MRSFEDPDLLTPDQRLSEVADILAVGVLRLRMRAAVLGSDSDPGILPESTRPRLEVFDETVLSVHNG
jgi:hypothetical protein